MWPQPLSTTSNGIVNPIMEGADPSVIRHNDEYLWCFADGNRSVALHRGPDLHAPGPKHVVWTAPQKGPASQELWAPEIHSIDGRWYIYFAASDGNNANHRVFVLVSDRQDPFGAYELRGPLYTGDDPDLRSDNRWAIDFTVLNHDGAAYGVWSGWAGTDDDVQRLYIAPMADPTTVAAPRTRLADNDDFDWERVDGPQSKGLKEGPQVFEHDGRVNLLFSAGASWLPSYCIGRLELRGPDPLDPEAWHKYPQPAFVGTSNHSGVGHATTVRSPDGTQHWLVYHSKVDSSPGWQRQVSIQPFSWHRGRPVFGTVMDEVPVPRGTPDRERRPRRTLELTEPSADMHFLGHHQLIDFSPDGMTLGRVPQDPANLYRCGEKVLLTDPAPGNLHIEVEIDTADDQRDVGILFRVSRPTLGYDCQRGYFAGIITEDQRLLIGRTDGTNWRELVSTDLPRSADGRYHLEVTANGTQLSARVGDVAVQTHDDLFTAGQVGLRVVNAQATFSHLQYAEILD
ncbi:MAG TPA: glycoside hydrolase family 43 protein [Actinomycetota bacterium]|nr:glycoside hydrolase family 43 protein [Actinomycetota bacterium]